MNMRRMVSTAITAALTLACSHALVAQARVTDKTLIEQLGSSDEDIRKDAVTHVLQNVPPGKRTRQLDRALADELARLNGVRARRIEADNAGKPLLGDFPSDYYSQVIDAVSQSVDPIVIPALLGAMGTGSMAQEGIVKFGVQTVPGLLTVARARAGDRPGDISAGIAADALTVLSLLMETNTLETNTQFGREVVILARERLTRGRDVGIVVAACRLAVATKDPALRSRVERLANTPSEVIALGVGRMGDRLRSETCEGFPAEEVRNRDFHRDGA